MIYKIGQKFVYRNDPDSNIYVFVNYVYDGAGNPNDESWRYHKIRALNRDKDDQEKYMDFDGLYTEQEMYKYFITIQEIRKQKLKKLNDTKM